MGRKQSNALILIRGVPGSGKTTMAHAIRKCYPPGKAVVHEADDFFLDENGIYRYDPKNIQYAHELCRQNTLKDLQDGLTVIVSNTFTRWWEIQHYLTPLEDSWKIYPRYIYVAPFNHNPFPNAHGVPPEKVQEMIKRFED